MSKTHIYKTQEMNIYKLNKDTDYKESHIHEYFENHLKTLINASVIKREYDIGKGRMDTLAIDDDNRPVIIEYKKDKVGTAILQALFYKHWLVNNRRTFELEVESKFGKDVADNIIWNQIRVIVVAQNFDDWSIFSTTFLSGVELFEYAFYDNKKFLKLKYIKEREENQISKLINKDNQDNKYIIIDKETNMEADYETANFIITKGGKENITNLGRYKKMPENLKSMYNEIKEFIFSLDPNIELFKTKEYWVFKNEKKFVEVNFQSQAIGIQLFLKEKPIEDIPYEWKGNKGHWGTFNDQFKISKKQNLEIIRKYIQI